MASSVLLLACLLDIILAASGIEVAEISPTGGVVMRTSSGRTDPPQSLVHVNHTVSTDGCQSTVTPDKSAGGHQGRNWMLWAHPVACRSGALKGWQLKTTRRRRSCNFGLGTDCNSDQSIQMKYSCCSKPRVGSYPEPDPESGICTHNSRFTGGQIWEKKGLDEGNGGVVYLDRHHVACPFGFLLTGWRLFQPKVGTLSIHYCCRKSVPLTCHKKKTAFQSDGGDMKGGLIYLDRHNVQCGTNEAMQEWRLQWNGDKNKMRIKYTCCSDSSTEEPTDSPSEEPTDAPTDNFDDPTPAPAPPLTTPAPDDDCLECRLDLSQLEHNPFEGAAPQVFDQNQTLKFKNVCQINDASYDLQLIIASGYSSDRPDQNHAVGNMFRFNVKAGSHASAKFTLMQDGQPAEDVKILFTLLDLDQGSDTKQWAKISDVLDYQKGPQVTFKGHSDSTYSFESQRIGDAADNPEDAMELDEVQLGSAVAVMTNYAFSLKFGINGSDPNGRQFYFAGPSALRPSFCNEVYE